ncbi:class I tRNA ligase family protein, partial [Klebsiella pneumoniae]
TRTYLFPDQIIELLNPRSTLSGATPVEKSSDHYFFKLPNFAEYLQKWTRDEGRLPLSIANKLDEWFETGHKIGMNCNGD